MPARHAQLTQYTWILLGHGPKRSFFTLLGLFHLQLWVRRRETATYLWFGCVALSMALREVAMTSWMNTSFGHPRLSYIQSWLFLQAASPPFIQFLWPFLDLRIPKWLRLYQLSFLVPCAVLFLPLEQSIPFTRVVGPFWGAPVLLLAPAVTLLQARRGHPEARTILVGMGLLLLGGLYELGFWFGLWPIFNTLSFGFVAFLVAMVVSISKRYARAHAEMEELTRTLEQILSVCGDRTACFWGTHGGAELDLLVQHAGQSPYSTPRTPLIWGPVRRRLPPEGVQRDDCGPAPC